MTTALGRAHAPPRRKPGLAPFVSVLVPVRNEERFIEATLCQLLEQDYPAGRFEILVADGRSDDATREIVRRIAAEHPEVRLIDNPGRLSSAGRNAAARAARGDLLVLIDGHCEVRNPSYLSQLADAFERSGADTIGRPQPLDVPSASMLQRAIAAGRESRFGHHPASSIWAGQDGFVPPQSVAVAYRREVFDRIGWFDESFDACEDYEFNTRCARAGMTCWLSTAATVRYHPRPSLAGLCRQMERYGRGRVRLLRKHPASFSAAVFLPALFLAGLLLGPLLAVFLPVLWWAYVGCVAAYAACSLAFSAAVAMSHRSLWMLPVLPAVFAAVHLGAGVGVLKELISGHREGAR
ncbi:MAG: glycosyltransferase family 2 protein [Gemmataceae bacterium]|nr:glycosyltransferase family 2 protein [Gemmataceae bacterium]